MIGLRAMAAAALVAVACSGGAPPAARGRVRIVLQHAPLWGPPGPFRTLLAAFERANPDIELVVRPMPNASDLAHQLLVTALEGGASGLDVVVVDVIWVPELARAGWIADLSAAFPPDKIRSEMLPGAADAVVLGGRTWAVPWYVDVGVLYWRTDLVPRAPRTYDELRGMIREVRARDPSIAGLLWQGRQYEGLSCNALEAIWGHGGKALVDDRIEVDTPAGRAGLEWLASLVESGDSPRSVTSAAEEESRRRFQQGDAVFMRNWPYALAELDAPGSAVRGRVAIAPLPSVDGRPGPGALGGWQLAIVAGTSPARRAAAERLVAHLSSPEAARVLAVSYARAPARREAYRDPRVVAEAPAIARLLPLVREARPRPPTPYWMLAADALQAELSAAVTGLRPPAEALQRAQRQIDRIQGEGP